MPREKTKDILADILGGGNEDNSSQVKKEEEKQKKKIKTTESKQPKYGIKEDDEYTRINITLKNKELKLLDETIDRLVEAGELQKKNRSFIIRLALKKFIKSIKY